MPAALTTPLSLCSGLDCKRTRRFLLFSGQPHQIQLQSGGLQHGSGWYEPLIPLHVCLNVFTIATERLSTPDNVCTLNLMPDQIKQQQSQSVLCFVYSVFRRNLVYSVSGGGGMIGLSSVNAGSDGKWTVTQISCHAGKTQYYRSS